MPPAAKFKIRVLREDQSVEEWIVSEPIGVGDLAVEKRTGAKGVVLSVQPS